MSPEDETESRRQNLLFTRYYSTDVFESKNCSPTIGAYYDTSNRCQLAEETVASSTIRNFSCFALWGASICVMTVPRLPLRLPQIRNLLQDAFTAFDTTDRRLCRTEFGEVASLPKIVLLARAMATLPDRYVAYSVPLMPNRQLTASPPLTNIDYTLRRHAEVVVFYGIWLDMISKYSVFSEVVEIVLNTTTLFSNRLDRACFMKACAW